MKPYISLIILLLTSVVSAQYKFGDINIDFGTKTPRESGNIMAMAGPTNNSIYTLSRTNKEFFLQTYNAHYKYLESSSSIMINGANDIEDFVIIGKKLFLMVSVYNQVSRNYHFLAKEIQNNRVVNSTVLLTVPVASNFRRGEFLFRISNDGSRYLVAYANRNNRNRTIDYSIVLVDGNLNTVFSDRGATDAAKRRYNTFRFSDIQLNQHGDIVFCVSESYRDRKAKKKYNHFTIYSYQANNHFQKKTMKIKIEGNYLTRGRIIPTKNDKLHILGFYSKLKENGRPYYGQYEGIYDLVIDYKEDQLVNKSFNPFPYEIREQVIGKRRAQQGDGLYYEWNQNIAFIERDNGGLFVFSEFSWKSEPDRFIWTIYTYKSEHTIVTALNPDGSLHWSNLIPKLQHATIDITGTPFIPRSLFQCIPMVPVPLDQMGTGEAYFSVFPIYHNGKLTVLYNDDIANVGITNVRDLGLIRDPKDMVTTVYTFDEETGERNRIDLDPMVFQKEQMVLKPLISHKISNNKYLIYGGNKNENALGELVLKN